MARFATPAFIVREAGRRFCVAEREQIQEALRTILEQRLQALGVHVDSVRLLDVDVPRISSV